jgi:hypothetical protein
VIYVDEEATGANVAEDLYIPPFDGLSYNFTVESGMSIVGGYVSGDNWRTPTGSATGTVLCGALSGGSCATRVLRIEGKTGVEIERLVVREALGWGRRRRAG